MEIELLGVPFDGYGRPGSQAAAAAALQEAGLAHAFRAHTIARTEDLVLPPFDTRRGPLTSLINEPALHAMSEQLNDRVSRAVEAGRFPVVYGGDCTTLLGIVPGLHSSAPHSLPTPARHSAGTNTGRHSSRERRSGLHSAGVGLMFVDGHEDTMPLDVSEDGEGANSELGLLLGLTGRLLEGPLTHVLPALAPEALTMLGQRDAAWRSEFNVASLRESGVWLRDWQDAAREPELHGRTAAHHLRRTSGRWWLHVDLDVLDPHELPAQGLPDVEDELHGLTWDQLTTLLTAALGAGGCAGWSLAIYDPDQDPDRSGAQRIVRFVEDVARVL